VSGPGAPAVELAGLHKRFAERAVLEGVDLTVAAGSVTALLGVSGSGKTTLLRIVAGFERADRGVVSVGGEIVDDGVRVVAPERRRVGYVPQEGALFPHLDVAHNVAFGLAGRRRRGSAKATVARLLEMVGLAGTAGRYPHELSGGQQQRVALARALAVSPRVILLDEPFSSLDAELRASVRADVLAVLDAAAATTVFVTHDQDEALAAAGQVALLAEGRIVQVAAPKELYAHPATPEVARFVGAANLVDGVFEGAGVRTALGLLALAGSSRGSGPAVVLVRPEQLDLEELAEGTAGPEGAVVLGQEFFGHDQMVRVGEPGHGEPLLVRVPGHRRLERGSRVRPRVLGPVVAWPREPQKSPAASENTSM
jgi:iron(III) transport system ATP-binding protein